MIDAFIKKLLSLPKLGLATEELKDMLAKLPAITESYDDLCTLRGDLQVEYAQKIGRASSDEETVAALREERDAKLAPVNKKIHTLEFKERLEMDIPFPADQVISRASYRELINICKYISETNNTDKIYLLRLTPYAFDKYITKYPHNFVLQDIPHIKLFIQSWQEFAITYDLLLQMLNRAWHKMKGETVNDETLIPMLSLILPHDLDTLRKLEASMRFLCELNKNSYYLSVLEKSVKYLLTLHEKCGLNAKGQLTEFDHEEYEPYKQTIKTVIQAEVEMPVPYTELTARAVIIREEDYLSSIEDILLNICKDMMQRYIKPLDLILDVYDIKKYRSKENETLEETNIRIAQMKNDIDSKQFPLTKLLEKMKSDGAIAFLQQHIEKATECILRYHAYMDIYQSMANPSNNRFIRLLTATNKAEARRDDFGEDFDKIPISLSPQFCKYLRIPVKTKSSLVNLFHPVAIDTEVTLGKVLHHLGYKMMEVEDTLNSAKQRILSTPSLVTAAANTNI